MIKCSICGKEVEVTFLGKLKGSYVKKKAVCSSCQRDLKNDQI